ncbi:MAG: hypothetical protein D6784_04075 [Chloroflexi bacterium]|nr:MAG: hypothetical protein D6784_04075 [Chloroflexota bacterium]
MKPQSIPILTQHNKIQLERLAYLQEYSRQTDSPRFKLALSQLIEDAEEAIARVSSQLRRLDASPGQVEKETSRQLLQQARARRGQAAQMKFVRQGLVLLLEWYDTHSRQLQDDPDSQAILTALAEQTRWRLNRFDNLLQELKVSP